MEFLIILISFLIFLFVLYKLSGDDHVLIRKNISLEHMFDVGFYIFWVSLLFSRIYYFLLHSDKVSTFFVTFLTTKGDLSLVGGIVSGIAALYYVSKYKKMPLGRLFDFFTLSVLFALPFGFLGIGFLHFKQVSMFVDFIAAFLYLLMAILFIKLLYPKLLNRTLKEGSISIYFLALFAVIDFLTKLVSLHMKGFTFITIDNGLLIILFILSIILFIKQEKGKIRKREA